MHYQSEQLSKIAPFNKHQSALKRTSNQTRFFSAEVLASAYEKFPHTVKQPHVKRPVSIQWGHDYEDRMQTIVQSSHFYS